MRILMNCALSLICVAALGQTAGDRDALSAFAARVKPKPAKEAVRTQVLFGRAAPALSVQRWFNSRDTEQRARLTLIDFWSMNCAPCVASFPKLAAIGQRHSPTGIRIVTIHPQDAFEQQKGLAGFPIAVQKPAADVLPDFLARRGIELPVGVDREGTTFRAFQIDHVPTYFLIDSDGRVRYESHALPGEADIAAATQKR